MLKTCLKEFWKSLTKPWISALALLIIVFLMLEFTNFIFYLGGWAEARKAPVCPLCGDARHEGLYLVDENGTTRAFDIRDYTVDVSRDERTNEITVCVTGRC